VKHFKNSQQINYESDHGNSYADRKRISPSFFKPARIIANLRDLRNRITAVVALVNRDMLTQVWDEMDYRINVCRISEGGHIEHL
jgi:hypothetical protein